jgi:ketosteroid isomerase-like protein
MDRAAVERWISRYEQSWRAPGTDHLTDVFTADATYRTAPFEEPYTGLPSIAALWEAERDSPDERFTLSTTIVAVEGQTAVVRAEVHYQDAPAREYRDLWIITLDAGGCCTAFEEWPFSPDHQGWFAPGPDHR